MFKQVQDAKERLKGIANVTPVLTCRTLNRLVGAEVFFKCENFQKIGAFKFRGAFNSITQLSTAEKTRGVITYSSGNHAQAVALVGQMMGIQTTIVMPNDAPEPRGPLPKITVQQLLNMILKKNPVRRLPKNLKHSMVIH